MRIVTLATCHNRREKTLSALADLHSQELPGSVSVEHVIVDDGSTDGTSEAIAKQFPDVQIVPGAGGLFWAGGMRHGWEEAVKQKEFDYLFVYNDDVCLKEDALARLVSVSSRFVSDGGVHEHVVVGTFETSDGDETSYGGMVRASRWHPLRFRRVEPPCGDYTLVDTLNMNGCLMAREALVNAGFLSSFFRHGWADYEYGLKLRLSGGAVVLAPGYIGMCDRNAAQDNFIEETEGFLGSFRYLLSIKMQDPYSRMMYYKRHGGSVWFLWFVLPYIAHPVRYFILKKRRSR